MKKTLVALLLAFLPLSASAAVTFPINGGSGNAGTLTGWLYGNGTSPYTASTSPFFDKFSFRLATGTAATTTSFFSTTASTTNLFGTNINGFGLATCATVGTSALTWSGGTFGCNTITSPTSLGTTSPWTVGQVAYVASNSAVTSVATSTLSAGSGLSFSGTVGYLVGGTNSTLGMAAIAANTVLGNSSSATVAPFAIATSSLFVWNGTGNVVRTTSPVLITPDLGVPTALTLTNATGLPAASVLAGTFGGSTKYTFPQDLVIIGNSTTTNATTTNLFSTTASSTNLFATTFGLSSTTPTTKLSVGSGAISVAEYQPATSTTPTIDWRNGNQQLYRTSTSATTVSFSNYIAGQKLVLVVCNAHAGTAGALTWDSAVLWSGGTIPTQTTTADKCDIWSFLATNGSSTLKILGAQNANY